MKYTRVNQIFVIDIAWNSSYFQPSTENKTFNAKAKTRWIQTAASNSDRETIGKSDIFNMNNDSIRFSTSIRHRWERYGTSKCKREIETEQTFRWLKNYSISLVLFVQSKSSTLLNICRRFFYAAAAVLFYCHKFSIYRQYWFFDVADINKPLPRQE